MPTRTLCLLTLSFVVFGFAHAQPPKTDAPKAVPKSEPKGDAVTYKDHVQPILRKHCLNCHNADKASSDLDVSTYQALMTGGASGEAVKAGNPGQSLLFRVTAHEVEPKMPPKGPKIPDADLAVLKKWIEGGAPETAVGAAKVAGRKVEIDAVAVTKGKPDGPPPMPASLPAVKLTKTERAHAVTAMAASPWAPLLAVSGHERVLLYNSDTLKLIGALEFPERTVHVLKFSRNGKWLLAGGGRGGAQGRVVIWEVTTGKRVTEIGDEADVVLAADVSPDHKLVALGDRNGGCYVWEPGTGGIVYTLGDHKDAVTALSWRADSQMLASASEDGRVIVWYAEDGFPTRSINAQVDAKAPPVARGKIPGVLAVQYARDGQLATCGRDNSARIWKADGSQVARLEGFTDVPSKVVFSHDGGRIFAGDFTGKIRAWDMKDKKPAGELSTNPD